MKFSRLSGCSRPRLNPSADTLHKDWQARSRHHGIEETLQSWRCLSACGRPASFESGLLYPCASSARRHVCELFRSLNYQRSQSARATRGCCRWLAPGEQSGWGRLRSNSDSVRAKWLQKCKDTWDLKRVQHMKTFMFVCCFWCCIQMI